MSQKPTSLHTTFLRKALWIGFGLFTLNSVAVAETPASRDIQSEYQASPLQALPPLPPQLQQALDFATQGDTNRALAEVQTFRLTNPYSYESDLLEGVVLDMSGQSIAAEKHFARMIKVDPSRPEPYNNLAVIYARQGRYKEAINQLWKLFDTHNTYGVAYQNLSRIYSTMAAGAYNRALSLESSPPAPEVTWVTQSPTPQLQPRSGQSSPQPAVQPTRLPTRVIQTTQTQQPSTVPTNVTPAPQPPITPQPADLTGPSAPTLPPVGANNATPPGVQVSSIGLGNLSEREQSLLNLGAHAAVQRWATAWSEQNVKEYLNAYTSNYSSSPKMSHQQWAQLRSGRIARPKFIRLELGELKINWQSLRQVTVDFVQNYSADHYSDKTRKRLTLVAVDGQWKISKEESLN